MTYRHLFSTHNQDNIAMAKALLDGEHIDYQIRHEFFSSVRPLVEPAEFVVSVEDFERAQTVIKELNTNFSPSWNKDKQQSATDNALQCMSCGAAIPDTMSSVRLDIRNDGFLTSCIRVPRVTGSGSPGSRVPRVTGPQGQAAKVENSPSAADILNR